MVVRRFSSSCETCELSIRYVDAVCQKNHWVWGWTVEWNQKLMNRSKGKVILHHQLNWNVEHIWIMHIPSYTSWMAIWPPITIPTDYSPQIKPLKMMHTLLKPGKCVQGPHTHTHTPTLPPSHFPRPKLHIHQQLSLQKLFTWSGCRLSGRHGSSIHPLLPLL